MISRQQAGGGGGGGTRSGERSCQIQGLFITRRGTIEESTSIEAPLTSCWGAILGL